MSPPDLLALLDAVGLALRAAPSRADFNGNAPNALVGFLGRLEVWHRDHRAPLLARVDALLVERAPRPCPECGEPLPGSAERCTARCRQRASRRRRAVTPPRDFGEAGSVSMSPGRSRATWTGNPGPGSNCP
ncbi:MAG: hypothetical protein L0027_16730 [Candidatus Rokubacteria bacterium]|nr:hypothetical protein [Candidatus Rokubacteria bacterium]